MEDEKAGNSWYYPDKYILRDRFLTGKRLDDTPAARADVLPPF